MLSKKFFFSSFLIAGLSIFSASPMGYHPGNAQHAPLRRQVFPALTQAQIEEHAMAIDDFRVEIQGRPITDRDINEYAEMSQRFASVGDRHNKRMLKQALLYEFTQNLMNTG